jgi:hypothetical protein
MAMSDRLNRVEALLSALAAENAELRETVNRLERTTRAVQPSSDDSIVGEPTERRFDRRALLSKLGGAGIAGAGLAIVGGALGATPAAASTGTMTYGGTPMDEGTDGTTLNANTASAAFKATNSGAGIGLFGKAAADDAPGVYGESFAPRTGIGVSGVSLNFRAVQGLGGDTGVYGGGDFVGVEGRSVMSGVGVVGHVDGTSDDTSGIAGVGVRAEINKSGSTFDPASTSIALAARNEGLGLGVSAISALGIGLKAQGQAAPLQLVPALGPGAPLPSSGSHTQGEVYVDSSGDVFVCTSNGTPGTWRKVSYSDTGYQLLSKAIRIYDTRTGFVAPFPLVKGKLSPSTSSGYDLQVTGTTVSGVAVPAGAKAVIGTLSVTGTDAPPSGAGYLTAFATGAPPNPVTADISWSLANQTLSTQILAPLSASGVMTIENGMAGGSSAAHVIFDAKGYVT